MQPQIVVGSCKVHRKLRDIVNRQLERNKIFNLVWIRVQTKIFQIPFYCHLLVQIRMLVKLNRK